MKEQFRLWYPNKDINVSYVDGSGIKQVWHYNGQKLLTDIQRIVNTYIRQGIKLTNRQLYYQLVAEGIIPNADKIYKRICTFLTDARYGGFIDWNALEDRGRVPERHAQWSNVKDLVESAVYSYRLPRWVNQKYYIELYCEKQAMESVLKPIADKYHIYFGYNKGYNSASPMYDLAKRVKKQIDNGKKVVILYLGDHDPSGLDMVRDVNERIIEFLTESYAHPEGTDPVGDDEDDPNFRVIQVALNSEQISKYNPPPNPAKLTDPRANKYVMTFGNVSWELDSLKPDVLIKLTEDAILSFLDVVKYKATIEREKSDIQKLRDFADSLVDEDDEEPDDTESDDESEEDD